MTETGLSIEEIRREYNTIRYVCIVLQVIELTNL